MKRMLVFILCMALILTMFGCAANDEEVALSSGDYYAVGDYETHMTPYLRLNMDDRSFVMSMSAVISYVEHGSFILKNDKLIATSQGTTFIFEIVDQTTLMLTDRGVNEYIKLPDNTVFKFSSDMQ